MKKVLIEVERDSFLTFVCWLRSVRIVEVDVDHVVSVYKFLDACEESLQEICDE